MSIESLCDKLGLTEEKCRVLTKELPNHCHVSTTSRQRSRWQECIASRRKGKGFDPQAIRELAKEYRAGKCP